MRQLAEQLAGDAHPQRSDRAGIIGVRVGRGEPRGRKSDSGSGADNPRFPICAEGEKRVRSLIRNP